MLRTDLHDGWTVRAVAGDPPPDVAAATVPATVPGSVHTDLLAAGLIADPYLDLNEQLLQWVGRTDWRYETSFAWAGGADERVDLVLEGLDTVARVELNGRTVAETRNMHRTYRVDVGALLSVGDNTLAVAFRSPVKAADEASEQIGRRPHVNTHPYNAIRKMACNFGWDWGPDLATVGIWKPISLQAWSGARLAAVRPLVSVDGTRGIVRVAVDVERAGLAGDLPLVARVGDVTVESVVPAGASSAVVEVVVEDAELWWPVGHGDQPLYDVTVELGGDLDTWSGRVGFRTVELRTEPDDRGTSFTFVINGRPVFVKGANWIPDDCFLERVTRERYAARITQSLDAGINLLRVWGGGIYEQDDFYELCDEQGLLVWQDFLFACAAYSEEEPLRSEVAAEARDNVTRLVAHPSLVLWNGNNENIWGYHDWGWQERLDGLSWGAGYYDDLLPSIVAELDGTRPYSNGSPYSVDPERHPNDPAHGSMHIWDVWNQRDYTVYRDYEPRFVSEFGWQGPPTWATLTRAISDEPLTPESPGVLLHQKAMEGNRKLETGLAPHLPQPRGMDDFHWATQLNQARAIAFGIEHFRSIAPHCSGAVVWQINDCWPVTSWAAVDGDGRKKPLWYALRRVFRPRLLTLQPRSGGLAVVVSNDSGEAWAGEVAVSRRAFDGRTLESAALPFSADAWGTVSVDLPKELTLAEDGTAELLVAEVPGAQRAVWFFAEDRDSALPAPELTTAVARTGRGYAVTVTAGALARDLTLLADKAAADAEVDEQLVTLLPGESVVFEVSTAAELDAAALTGWSVLRSANQLLHPRTP
ncbi:beta-mannosidase [Motilibacter rhizosphaerae]|uniref:beta-mannosidase n=1 Tax=Motilibacter rhizosphaerae TaxID=598652 RepID=A0A4Q7NX26_9ACTN|nr:glycoside hydrolase family 2 protein [Motilibacter rhizosphaerae]RZS91468.1 beta-mannosidase [Motilibacter rhizosphaerae]